MSKEVLETLEFMTEDDYLQLCRAAELALKYPVRRVAPVESYDIHKVNEHSSGVNEGKL